MSFNIIQNNKLQLLGKLTASLFHEIRNPLSAVRLNLDFIKMYKDELPTEVNESLDDCYEALTRIQVMIDQMLGFTRKNQIELEKKLAINKVTEDAITLVSYRSKKENVSFEKHLDETIPYINFDENKLLQILLNLITNAVDSVSEKGKIIVRTYKKNSGGRFIVFWEVEDNGSGISEENKSKIFEDFFTSKKHGTGLGLSVCKMLLEEDNAKINFESQINKGTKFTIQFQPLDVELHE
jgi:signal transduction histidine kinase